MLKTANFWVSQQTEDESYLDISDNNFAESIGQHVLCSLV